MSAASLYKIKQQSDVQLIQDQFLILKKRMAELKPSKIVVLYDVRIKRHLKRYTPVLKSKNVYFIPLKVSESLKNFKTYQMLIEKLVFLGADKKTCIVAIGGGVIGDISGFVAQTYMRGLPWVSVPTTLLAQVDSGLGGKNALNTEDVKNLIGTVYQPTCIFLDSQFLKTLSLRDYQSSLGEILKYTYLNSKIKINPKTIQELLTKKQSQSLRALILKCAKLKMEYITKDPLDQTGVRQKLNFGHTFGHALEKLTAYKTYRHGEAILIGMKFALIVSYHRGLIKFRDFRSILTELNRFKVPKIPKKYRAVDFYKVALKDKKSHSGSVHMVLIEKRGRTINPETVTLAEFQEAFDVLKDFDL